MTSKNLLAFSVGIGKNLPDEQIGADNGVHKLRTIAGTIQPRHLIGVGIGLAAVMLVAWVTFELTLNASVHAQGQQAQRRLALFDRTLEAIIERFHYLPVAISQAEEAQAVLEAPGVQARVEAANGFLSQINETAGADEIFVMDLAGSVVAASNWWTLTSLVGKDYSFRPYFADAMANGRTKYYAFGISTSVPGYFLSERIDGPDGPLGVAVTKINLGEIEANWWRSGELIAILDVNDVAILSTRPDWRYRPLLGMDAPRASQVVSEQRYGDNGVENRGIIADRWPSRGGEFAYIAGSEPEASGYFVVQELRIPTHGWRIMSFTPAGPLFAAAWTSAAAAGLGAAALVLIGVLLAQRQRTVSARLAEHDRLEQRVALRTAELRAANQHLLEEIAERQRAEKQRRDAQEGLVQSAKLASLGQALAGVAHEISQPVAALSTHLASAQLLASRSRDAETQTVLKGMDKVVSRLAALTGHLKTFARKESDVSLTADLKASLIDALELADHKLVAFGITTRLDLPSAPVMVRGNRVHLEQVLLNLVSNAADAMEHAEERVLSVVLEAEGPTVGLTVSDTGEGIAADNLANLFDPFFTTKEAGRGLGLGLSISYGLVRDMGGTITAHGAPGAGAVFTVSLNRAAAESTQSVLEPA